MPELVFNVLFLCTGNSARSIIAESLIDYWRKGRFRGFSAGSHPQPGVHPLAVDTLESLDLPTDNLRSKSWEEFSGDNAPAIDFVFTICDNTAAEGCPVWPGKPVTAHWGLADPAEVAGDPDTRKRAFRETCRQLEKRIKAFVGLPIESMDWTTLKQSVEEIGLAET